MSTCPNVKSPDQPATFASAAVRYNPTELIEPRKSWFRRCPEAMRDSERWLSLICLFSAKCAGMDRGVMRCEASGAGTKCGVI